MSDYIKREDAMSIIREAFSNVDICPSADVVEVVRCKDCIFNNDGWCGADHLGSRWIEAEDYCSFGERKDDERK